MAARKGIKPKIVEWLKTNPDEVVTGRQLEEMYVTHGGSAYPADDPRKDRRGRVAQDTMKSLVYSLPVIRVSEGPSETNHFKRYFAGARFQYDKERDAKKKQRHL